MQKPSKPFLIMGILFAFCVGSEQSQAAAITNLSDKQQLIQIQTSDGLTSIPIEANQTWRVPGKVDVVRAGRETHMEEDDEFAIWPDGNFGPQRRVRSGANFISR